MGSRRRKDMGRLRRDDRQGYRAIAKNEERFIRENLAKKKSMPN
jgi:hypothetical protein